MKLMLMSLVGVLTASAMTPVAADAQRWRDDRGWHSGRYQHGGRWYGPPRRYYVVVMDMGGAGAGRSSARCAAIVRCATARSGAATAFVTELDA